MKLSMDVITGVIVLIIVAVLATTGINTDHGMEVSIAMDPGWYPRLLLIIAALACIVLMGAAWLKPGSALRQKPFSEAKSYRRLIFGAIAVTGYVGAFWWLGYWLATLAFLPMFSIGFGFRKPVPIALTTLIFTVLVWLVFTQLLQISLTSWSF